MMTAGGAGTDLSTAIGPIVGSETVAAGLYLLANATAASASNYTLYGDGSSANYLNAPSLLHFSIGGADKMRINGSAVSIGANPAIPEYIFDCSTTAVQHFGVTATSAKILYDASITGNGAALTIQGQDGYGTHPSIGGDIVLTPGVAAGGGTTNGKVQFNTTAITATGGSGATMTASIGVSGGPATAAVDSWIPIKKSDGTVAWLPCWK
jgi:hypothetical protein